LLLLVQESPEAQLVIGVQLEQTRLLWAVQAALGYWPLGHPVEHATQAPSCKK
jgi:hypothetical protein